jgi:hypothetical protein
MWPSGRGRRTNFSNVFQGPGKSNNKQGAEQFMRTLRERSVRLRAKRFGETAPEPEGRRREPGREEAVAPKAQDRGNPAVLPERGARGASRAKSEASANQGCRTPILTLE